MHFPEAFWGVLLLKLIYMAEFIFNKYFMNFWFRANAFLV